MSAPDFIHRLREDFDAAAARLPAAVVPAAARRAAVDRLVALGLPGLRDDAWRYADLRPLRSAALRPAANEVLTAGTLPALPAAIAGSQRLVFVDGRLDAAASTPVDDTLLRPLGALAAGAERSGETRFALLNDAFALDAARFAVHGDGVLELVFVASDAAGASYPRVQLELVPGARLTLVERHVGTGAATLSSAVAELALGRDALCRWYRLQDLAGDATHLEALRARLDAGATLEAVMLQLGGGAVRTTFDCDLYGRGASLQLHAASLAGGARTQDGAITVRHLAPETRSQQELRAIASGRAGIAFRSAVCVGRDATGADSRQSLKGLIGGDGAEVNLRPELEIDVDSVRASHGATTGAIDEGMLFYLLSRGLDRDTARQLLEWAFIEAVIGGVGDGALRREFEERTVAHLGNRAALEVLA